MKILSEVASLRNECGGGQPIFKPAGLLDVGPGGDAASVALRWLCGRRACRREGRQIVHTRPRMAHLAGPPAAQPSGKLHSAGLGCLHERGRLDLDRAHEGKILPPAQREARPIGR